MSTKNAIDALIADSQPLTVAGLETFLSVKQGIKIVGKVSKGGDLIDLMEKLQPALLIVEYNIPGYISVDDIRNAMLTSTKTNVLILSSDNNKATILEALQLGVKGYITKECSLEEVGMAVQSTARGEKFFCHKVLDIIMEKHFSVTAESEPTVLTTRETEILKLIAHGHSTQGIADTLFLSPHTVQTHRKSIIKKLNIKSPTEFVIYAMDLGLLKPR
ncbi:MAG TPA: response regulator transcription factor [Chryseolinea sp.]|jgi:DNA-binding NarL/FixJ family response regulator|nr:response regulator transcription factor [Chryseolinea sp.]